MVSTRRTAREEAAADMAEPNLSNALRKKPVRKATAKKTDTQLGPKTRRGRTSAVPAEDNRVDGMYEQAPAPALQAKPVRRAAGRPENVATPRADELASVAVKPVKTARAAATRSKKPDVMVDEIAEEPTTSQSRATRATKATAAKAQPLSPKKITQVNGPQTRYTKPCTQKAAPSKVTSTKLMVRGRGAIRRRTASDENADIPELAPSTEEDEDVPVIRTTPVKRMSPAKPGAISEEAAPSEGIMSSRPTTPSDSPAPNFEQEYTRQPDLEENASSPVETPEKQVYHGLEAGSSDDELCGPNTPMRRCSSSAEARWRASSAKHTAGKVQREKPERSLAGLFIDETPQPPSPLFGEDTQSTLEKPSEEPVTRSSRGDSENGDDNEPVAELANDEPFAAADDSVTQALERHADPDETIVMPEETEVVKPFETDDTEVISRDEYVIELAHESEVEEEPAEMGWLTPETIVWENIRQDVTIPIDVDAHCSGARTLTQAEAIEHWSLAASLYTNDDVAAWEAAAFTQTAELHKLDAKPDVKSDFDVPALEVPATLNRTINLNEFINLGKLDEPTQPIDVTGLVPDADHSTSVADNHDEYAAQVKEPEPGTPQAQVSEPGEAETDVVGNGDTVEKGAIVNNEEPELPHYALPTLAFDARRKSLPALGLRTPANTATRPNTSDGASMPRLVNAFGQAWWLQRPNESAAPTRRILPARVRAGATNGTPSAEGPTTYVIANPGATPKERYPVLQSDPNDAEHAKTAALPTRHRTPVHTWLKRAASASKPSASAVTPSASSLRPRHQDSDAESDTEVDTFELETPTQPKAAHAATVETPADNVRGLASRQTYQQHANTAVAPSRFRIPIQQGFDGPAVTLKMYANVVTPRDSALRPEPMRAEDVAATAVTAAPAESKAPIETPFERFSRLGPRPPYEAHPNTAVARSTFRGPVQQSSDRPATTRKMSSNAVAPRSSDLRPKPTQAEVAATPAPATPAESEAPLDTPSERFPRLESCRTCPQHAQTVRPARFNTPAQPAVQRPATAQKAAANATTPRASTPWSKPVTVPNAAATPVLGPPAAHSDASPASTVATLKFLKERFPNMPALSDNEEHAKTVAAPRHRTPLQTLLKRPSTVQKPGSLRKVVLKDATPMASHTPIKTPLKPAMITPGQAPLTPHPSAPLRGVIALVEVYTLEGASASSPFVALLHRLGAKTTRAWTDRVTHVIFKDGSPTTLQRVRLHNKAVDESGSATHIHCVNSRWVSACDAEGQRVDELDEAYAVDVAEIPRGGKRRRKSMEPAALVKLSGNIVQERKCSLGRGSIGRMSLAPPMMFDPLAKAPAEEEARPAKAVIEEKENTCVAEDEAGSPVTPAYLAAPDKLIQQTAPVKRMRKLGSKTQEAAKNRRLTFAPRAV